MADCATCGYVGLLEGDGQLVELDYRYRTEAKRDLPEHVQPRPFDNIPRCLRRPEMDFRQRMVARIADTLETENAVYWKEADLVTVLHEQIDCDHWYQWTSHLRPKEHLEMEFRQRMQQSAERLERSRQGFEERLFKEGESTQKQMAQATKSAARWQALSVVVGAGGLVAAIWLATRGEPAVVITYQPTAAAAVTPTATNVAAATPVLVPSP